MENEVQNFNFEGNMVRTLVIDDEIWFVVTDITNSLGFTNPTKAVQDHVDDEDLKTLTYKASNSELKAKLWSGNDYSSKVLTKESGMYSLVLGSQLKSAKRFKHWVTSEVLPSIRKTGSYSQPIENLSPEIQFINALTKQITQQEIETKRLRKEQEKQSNKLDKLTDIVSIDSSNWRTETNKVIRRIASSNGGLKMTGKVYNQVYKELETREHLNLTTRLNHMIKNMESNGTSKSKIAKVNNLDVIGNDRQLIHLFVALVKDFAIKSGDWKNDYEENIE